MLLLCVQTFAQITAAQQGIIILSKQKWQWVADKNVDSLNLLFDQKSVFVHMGGSWGTEREINVIKNMEFFIEPGAENVYSIFIFFYWQKVFYFYESKEFKYKTMMFIM